MGRALPIVGGSQDGGYWRSSEPFWVAADGAVYFRQDGCWQYCGPRSGVCQGCGALVVLAPGDEVRCDLCGARPVLPGGH
jgi:DNA directed RNA polymerase, 7 kDa subunit